MNAISKWIAISKLDFFSFFYTLLNRNEDPRSPKRGHRDPTGVLTTKKDVAVVLGAALFVVIVSRVFFGLLTICCLLRLA